MPQLVNANGLASSRAAVSTTQTVQAAQQAAAEPEASRFELSAEADPSGTPGTAPQAQHASVADELLLPLVNAELPPLPEVVPAEAGLAQAQQWLDSMLQQQAAQLSAQPSIAAVVSDEVLPALLTRAVTLPGVTTTMPAQANSSLQTGAVTLLKHGAMARPEGAVMASQLATAPFSEAPLSPVASSTQSLATPEVPALAPSGVLPGVPEAAPSTALLGAVAAPADSLPMPTAALASSLKLQAPQAQYGQQMLNSLRDSVELQVSQQVQNATIRLDPPELGSLEIYVRHDNGRLSVQLSASNTEVTRLLQQTGERLRQELVGQNFVQVNVQVSTDSQGGRQGGQPAPSQLWADERIRASDEELDATAASHNPTSRDVLVTV